jgi:hypothetical protein
VIPSTAATGPRRCAPALLATALLVTACGVRPSGVIRGGPAPTAASSATVYLVADGRVAPVRRPDTASALALLAAGPTADELGQGFTTELPAGTTLTASGTTVTVSVDVTSLSTNAVAQIVCTAGPAPVTLVGGDRSRGPLACPAV